MVDWGSILRVISFSQCQNVLGSLLRLNLHALLLPTLSSFLCW